MGYIRLQLGVLAVIDLNARQRVTYLQQGGRRTNLRQLKLLQAWEGWRLDDLIGACHQYGFTGVVVKALDGADWMSRFDGSLDAISSVEDVAAQAFRMRAEGLYYVAWTVPKDQGDIALQATLSGQIAAVCDGLFLDVEPYSGFWGASRPEGDAAQFMRWLRAEAPSSFVALQPDPRPEHLAEIHAEEWLPAVDVLAGQHYWSDFGTNPTAELEAAIGLGQQFGIPILPTLPGNAGLGTFPLDLIATLPGFVVWRWGTTPTDTLEALGSSLIAGFKSSRIRGW